MQMYGSIINYDLNRESVDKLILADILTDTQLFYEYTKYIRMVHREFLKNRFSRCMLYRHNAAIGADWNLFFFGII